MIRAGISTACFYPLTVEEALEKTAATGARCAEVFVNARQEFTKPFFERLRERARAHGIDIVSIHPFTAGFESMYFFSTYKRRFEDGMEEYSRYFELTQFIGARYFVLHGAGAFADMGDEEVYERIRLLSHAAKMQGVTLLQENVSRCRSGAPAFVAGLRRQLGEEIGFVLDIKQAVRAGCAVHEMLDAMGDRLCHVHISDHAPGAGKECLLPGKGTFDIAAFARTLQERHFDGSLILELYRGGYDSEDELRAALSYLTRLLPQQ